MPDNCDAPHCRKSIKSNEDRAWCSLCTRVMHKNCQQYVNKVDDIRICFYCNLSPDVTVKTVDKLRDYFTKKIEDKKKRMEKEKNARDENKTVNQKVKGDMKESKIKADMKNIAEKQQLNVNDEKKSQNIYKDAYKIEQKANKQEQLPRNPFNENDRENTDDTTMIKMTDEKTSRNPFEANLYEHDDNSKGIITKREYQSQRHALNEKHLNGSNKVMGMKMIDADKIPGNPFNDDKYINDDDMTTMINKHEADSENMREKSIYEIMKEMKNNKESIQEDTNKHDEKIESAVQKQILSYNRRAVNSETQDNSKLRGVKIQYNLKDDERPFSNVQDPSKIHDTNEIPKNEPQANRLQEDVLKVLETINRQNRLLESLVINGNRLEQSKNQNSSCNLM